MTAPLQDLEFLRELEDLVGIATDALASRLSVPMSPQTATDQDLRERWEAMRAMLKHRLAKARATETQILRMIEEAKA